MRYHHCPGGCIHCESVGGGLWRVIRWALALVVGFVGGGLAFLILLLLIAELLK